MAYELNYWMMAGTSDQCIKTIRIARKEDITTQRLIETRPVQTDLITLDRTDRQSPYYQEIWKSTSYISLDERASKPKSTDDIKHISPIEMVKAVYKLAEFYNHYSPSRENVELNLYSAKMLVTIFAKGLDSPNIYTQKAIAQILNNWPTS